MKKYKTIVQFLHLAIIFGLAGGCSGLPLLASQVDSLKKLLPTMSRDTHRVLVVYEIGWQLKQTDPQNSIAYAKEAMDLAVQLHFSKGQALSASLLGFHARINNDFHAAESLYLSSLDARIIIGDPIMVSGSYFNLGRLYSDQGNLPKAIVAFESALNSIASLSVPDEEASILNALGAVHRRQGDLKRAANALARSRAIRKKQMETRRTPIDSLRFGKSELNLGNLFFDQGNLNAADSVYNGIVDIFRKYGSNGDWARLNNNLGLLASANGEKKLAELRFQEAIDAAFGAGDSIQGAFTLINWGKHYTDYKMMDAAINSQIQAITIFQKMRNTEGVSKAKLNLGRTQKSKGEYLTAESSLQEALAATSETPNPFFRIEILNEFADLKTKMGDLQSALKYSQESSNLEDSVYQEVLSSIFLTNNLERSQAQHQLLERENEIAHQKVEQLRQQDRFLLLLVIGLVIVLAVCILLIVQRQKAIRFEKAKNEAIMEAGKKAKMIAELIRDQEYRSLIAMAEGQKVERKRISEALHDNLGGHLATIKLHFKSLQAKASPGTPIEAKVGTLTQLVDEAIQLVRTISHNLVSGALRNFGLHSALQQLNRTINDSGQVLMNLSVHGISDQERIDLDLEIKIYNMIQELTSNALRHSKATHLDIQLLKTEGLLNLLVSDNGRGFNPEEISSKSGIGLGTIQTRIKDIGGSIAIDSGRGNGTTINIDIPINEYDNEN